jgi:hypothetical protein
MPKQLVSIPHPEDVWAQTQAEPFTLGDTLTIADAAMLYSDRHPRPVIWFGAGALNPRKPTDINEIEELIGKGATDHHGPGTLEYWEKSWSVYCALADGVQKGSMPATKPVYLPNRRINPVLTEIPLSALLDLARQRGDAGEIVSSLLTWYEDNPPEPAAETPLATEPTVTTAEPASVERRTRPQGSRGPKPGMTGFNAADRALFPEIKQMLKDGKARSVIAAARILATQQKVGSSGGTTESRAVRVARRYGQWKSASTPKG